MSDARRMRTACFARAPQRYTRRLIKHFLLIFQEVTPPSKTRNQLKVTSEQAPRNLLIEPPREGPLNRAKVLISGIVKHALTGTMPLPLEQRAGTGLMLRLNSAEWQPTATCVTLR